MSAYSISVFLHIVGAHGIFAAIGLEWAGLSNLRRATDTIQVREWMRLLAAPRTLGGPSALLILLSGIYMSATRWGPQGWIVVALGGMVAIAAVGGAVGGRRAAAIARALPPEAGPVSPTEDGLVKKLPAPVPADADGIAPGLSAVYSEDEPPVRPPNPEPGA